MSISGPDLISQRYNRLQGISDAQVKLCKNVRFLFAICCAPVMWSGSALAQDGSGTSNPALLQGADVSSCQNVLTCTPVFRKSYGVNSASVKTVASEIASVPTPTTGAIDASATTASVPGNCAELIAAGIVSAECQTNAQTAQPVQQQAPQPIAPQAVSTAQDAPIELEAVSGEGALYVPDPNVLPEYEPNAAPKSQARLAAAPQYARITDGVDLDWRVSLRGAYVSEDDDSYFETALRARSTANFASSRGSNQVSGDVDIRAFGEGELRFNSGEVAHNGRFDVNGVTQVTDALRLGLSQDAPSDGYTQEALVLNGAAALGVTRSAGRMQWSLNGSLDRTDFGESIGDDDTAYDNSWRNHTGVGVDGRAQMGITSVLYGYAKAGARRELYDGISPSSGASYDNWTYTTRAGLGAAWRNGLTADVWGGYGWRLFDDAVPNADSWLYGASLAYGLPEKIEVSLAYDSAIEDADVTSNASTIFTHTLSLELRQAVNSWLTARANGSASWVEYANSDATNNGYSFGAGVDVKMSRNMSVVADYAFDTDEEDGSSHTVSAGVSWSR